MSTRQGEPILKLENISKSFPGVKALNNISLNVYSGMTHAIVGENGAGKSTLMNILSGVFEADDGKIYLEGKEVKFKRNIESQRLGIAMINQELSVATNMSVGENIFLGKYPLGKFKLINQKKMTLEAKRILSILNMDYINPNLVLGKLSISERQMVEIAKALSLNPKVMIMDEPTSSLTAHETRTLLNIIGKLKNEGVAILYISHRLNEVFEIADQITVLRDGNLINTVYKNEVDSEKVISMMVGRDLSQQKFSKIKNSSAKTILEVRNLNWPKKLYNINLQLKEGEILGFAGLVGAGRSELAQAIFGMVPEAGGDIFVNGEKVNIKRPKDAIRLGIGLVPEDRKLQGAFLGLNVKENISIATLKMLKKLFLLDNKKEVINANRYVEKLKIKTPSLYQYMKNLSGGNQQKSILARWLLTNPKILILDEPTHGIDVGTKAEIYNLMKKLTAEGVSLILISSELPEILLMSDRIAIMRDGKILKILEHDEVNAERIMAYATGQAS